MKIRVRAAIVLVLTLTGCSAPPLSGHPASSTTMGHTGSAGARTDSGIGFSVQWTDGPTGVVRWKPIPPGSITSYTKAMRQLHLVEHVSSEYNVSAISMASVVSALARACGGIPTVWQGYPSVRCSGPYFPVDPGIIAADTVSTLRIRAANEAVQSVLIVRTGPTHIYVVDAVSLPGYLSRGRRFVSSFRVLPPTSSGVT